MFSQGFRLYGYGELNQILSGTAFSYIDTSLIISAIVYSYSPSIIKSFFGLFYRPPLLLLSEGFQKVFQNLTTQMQKSKVPLQLYLNTKINQIESTENGVVVHGDNGFLHTAKAAYVTSGWQNINMPGINKDVSQLFQGLIHENYGTTIFKTKEPIVYKGILDYTSTGYDPLAYITKFKKNSKHIGIAYTKGDEYQGGEIFSNLKKYLADKKITVDGELPLAQRQLEYHHRFTHTAIKDGAYRTIDMHQGTGNIFFGGAPLSFDLTEAVAAFSKQMSKRIGNFLKK
jgi:hypothetical protein